MKKADGRYLVPGLIRGLQLLRAFSPERSAATLTQLAEAMGLSRAAAYRLVYTLEHEGYLLRDESTGLYRLSSRVLDLGFEYLAALELPKVAEPHLQALSRALGANAHLGVRDGHDVVYVLRVVAPTRLVTNIHVGTRAAVHATTMGRMLVASLGAAELASIYEGLKGRSAPLARPATLKAFKTQAERDASRGFVVLPSAYDPGILSVAAAVRDQQGRTVAAINVSGAEAAMRRLGVEARVVPSVTQTALEISRELGYRDKGRLQEFA